MPKKKKKNIEQLNEELGAFSGHPSTKGATTMSESFSNDSFTFSPDFSETYDEVALPAGSEVEVEVRYADVGTSQKSGGKYIRLGLTIPSEPTSKDFNEFIHLPGSDDDPKTANRKNQRLRAFMRCMDLDESRTFSPTDLIGLSGWVILGMKEDQEYGEQNFVKKFIAR